MRFDHRALELHLRHTFRIARGASDVRRNVVVEVDDGRHVGLGGGRADLAVSRGRGVHDGGDPGDGPEAAGTCGPTHQAAARAAVPGQRAAEAAIDMALHDLAGKRLGAPVYDLLGIAPGPLPETSFTIALDTPDVVAAKVREASAYAILKVKMGSDDDRAVLEAVRDTAPHQRIRVDANEGWTARGRAGAARMAPPAGGRARRAAASRGSPGRDPGLAPHRARCPSTPTRACIAPRTSPRLAGAYDGIDIKLMKCSGLGEAMRMVAVARAPR